PADSYWPAVDGLLHVSLPQHDGIVAAIPQPADLGRVCGVHLRYGLAVVLVCGSDPRFGDLAGSRGWQAQADHLRDARDGMARFGAQLASLSDSLPAAGGLGDASCAFRAYRSEL